MGLALKYAFATLLLTLAACTSSNPTYCDEREPCAAGWVCDFGRRTCVAEVDAAAEQAREDPRSCGCPAGETCTASGECCKPESNVDFCARLKAACGELKAPDNCGQLRSASCGECPFGETCEPKSRTCACLSGPLISAETDPAEPAPRPGRADIDVEPRIACGSRRCLVVWSEASRVVATRIDPSGEVLDPSGIYVGETARRGELAVAHGDGQFLVTYLNPSIHGEARRISEDGVVLDVEPIAWTQAAEDFHGPQISFTSSIFLLVWGTRTSGVLGTRISAAGRVLDSQPITIVSQPGPAAYDQPATSAAGTAFCVATWVFSGSSFELIERTVRADGVLDAEETRRFAKEVFGRPTVTSNGSRFLFLFAVTGRESDVELWSSYRPAAGLTPEQVTDGLPADYSGSAAVESPYTGWGFWQTAWDGSSFVVVWVRDGEVLARRLRVPGLPDAEPTVLLGKDTKRTYTHAAVGSINGRTLVAALGANDAGGAPALVGMVIDADLRAVAGPASWSTRAARHEQVRLATTGRDFRAIWSTEDDEIQTRLLDQNGRYAGAPMGLGDRLGAKNAIGLAAANGDYLVTWPDAKSLRIQVARVRREDRNDGDLPRIPIEASLAMTGYEEIALIERDGQHFLGWGAVPAGSGSDFFAPRQVFGVPLASDGTPTQTSAKTLLPAPPPADYFPRAYQAAFASDGAGYLMVWTTRDSLRAATITTDGDIPQPEGNTVASSSPLAEDIVRPRVAFNGTSYLVAWLVRSKHQGYRIAAARLSRDGTLLDAVPLVLSAAGGKEASEPAVTRYGNRFLVAWPQKQASNEWRLAAALIDSAGAVTGPGLVGDAFPSPAYSLEAHEGPRGQVLVGYVRLDTEPPYGTDRVRTRLFAWDAAKESCQDRP